MASHPKSYFTPEQYLALERAASQRSEYLAGKIYAMAGASEAHNLITLNAITSLRAQTRGRCRAYLRDMRVRVPATRLFTYPDGILVCGERRFDDAQRDTLLNPTLLIEVLSDSTERYDRGQKFAHYRQIASLQEYLLIAQDAPRVERFLRQPTDEWLLTIVEGRDATLPLPSVACTLTLAELYEEVDFNDESDSA